MITKDNLVEVIKSISDKDKKRIKNTDKEYTVIYLHIFNAGFTVSVTLTNNYNRYKNVSNQGNCILLTDEVLYFLK